MKLTRSCWEVPKNLMLIIMLDYQTSRNWWLAKQYIPMDEI